MLIFQGPDHDCEYTSANFVRPLSNVYKVLATRKCGVKNQHRCLKKYFVRCLTNIFAQEKIRIKSTSPSPEASFEQEIGSTIIKVTYARPLARGRKIFGDLVPMDSLWRTGASNATSIHSNEEIVFGGKTLAAGKYSLFTIPRI